MPPSQARGPALVLDELARRGVIEHVEHQPGTAQRRPGVARGQPPGGGLDLDADGAEPPAPQRLGLSRAELGHAPNPARRAAE